MATDICYRCERLATTREHVPPKCLFPEPKDCNGENYRENLITVPSCDIHNTRKSSDDQFLLVCLTRLINGNHVSFNMNNTKTKRTILRKPHIVDSLLKNRIEFPITLDEKTINLTVCNPDYERLNLCFENIFFGIYRHHFGKNFLGEVKIFIDFLYYQDEFHNNLKKIIEYISKNDLRNSQIFGENKEIFYYQFSEPDVNGIVLCKTVYYENIVVYGAFASEKPKDLVSLLMQEGYPITFSFDNGEKVALQIPHEKK